MNDLTIIDIVMVSEK